MITLLRETDDTGSIFKPTLVLMSGRMLSFIATFFIPVVLVRLFAPGEFGTYKQAFLIYMTVYGIAQLGMAESLFYFLPRAPKKAGRYAMNSLLMLLAAAVLFSGLLMEEKSRISEWLSNSGLAQYLPLLAVYLLLMTMSATLEIVMISRKQYRRAALSYAVSDVLRAAFLIVPAVLLRSLYGLFLGAVAFALLRFVITLFYFWREFGDEFRPDVRLLQQQLAYALPFEMAIVVETLHMNFHQYAVSHYFDAATFAIYAVGCLQIPLVEFLASPAGNVMMVRMSEEIRDGRNDSVVALWHETTRKLALIFIPLFGLLVVTARDLIVFLFTESYVASVSIFMVWSLTVLLSAFQTDAALRVYAQTRFLFMLHLLRLLIIVGLISVFLSGFGLLGAVLITLLSLAIAKALSLFRLKQLMQISIAQLLPWGSLAAVGAVSLAAFLIAQSVESTLGFSVMLRLLVVGLVYMVSYLVLLMRFDLLNSREKSGIAIWLQRFTVEKSPKKKVREQLEEEKPCAVSSES
ncbi:MAG: polysaccharide biosynthesis protein [Acidobacteria bacterium]|nr:polysaccharide biosynthesis protein [Acidobacteriota bacterium]